MMNVEMLIVFSTLLGALVLFATDWLRYDVVALLALLTVTVTGIIPPEIAFNGFGEPAVIVVGAVLVVSRGLYEAGIADLLASAMLRAKSGMSAQLGVINSIIASISGFMSNTGALALFLPVVIKIARRRERSPSAFLMPLAASGLLGGLITLIGTPPNLIIANFRGDVAGAEPFAMFDYLPVGLGVAVAGVAFVCVVGWRLLPEREAKNDKEALFEIEAFLTEMRVLPDSELVGDSLEDLETDLDADVTVVALLRDGEKMTAPSGFEQIEVDDFLLLQIHASDVDELLDVGLDPTHSEESNPESDTENAESDEVKLVEAVIAANSPLEGETVRNIDIRWRHGINLLAVARQNERIDRPLDDITLRGGDILLLQGAPSVINEALPRMGCLPLQERNLNRHQQRRLLLSGIIFAATIAVVATGLLAVEVAFTAAAVLMIMTGLLSLDDAYDAINFPILILIGAMLPLGEALETSGGAEFIADSLLLVSSMLPPIGTLALLLVITMLLSNFVHNAAVAALLAPVAVSIAQGLNVSIDPFLMAVAVGASATFMTPIGHQANTIVMEAGGYEFDDYWRMGLPLSLIVVVVAVPLIALVWSF